MAKQKLKAELLQEIEELDLLVVNLKNEITRKNRQITAINDEAYRLGNLYKKEKQAKNITFITLIITLIALLSVLVINYCI